MLECAHAYFSGDITIKDKLFAEVYKYALYLANSTVKKHRGYWNKYNAGESPAQDACLFAVEKFIEYIDSEKCIKGLWAFNAVSYITRFLKNRISDFLNKVRNQLELSQFRIDCLENPDSLLVEEDDAPYLETEKSVNLELVKRALSEVPHELAEVFEDRYGKCLSPREIAMKKGIPVTKVYSQISKLKSLVKEKINPDLVA